MKGYFVTGTDTGVGKTEVAAHLARYFAKKNLSVGVMKPVAAGVIGSSRDAVILKKYSKSRHSIEVINPISLRLPLAPMVAAEIEKKKIDLKILWCNFNKIKRDSDIVIVEGVGGPMVPICRYKKKIFYVLDLIEKMNLPVIVVARPNLGTINHTLLTINTLEARKIKIAGIILNHSNRVKNDISLKTNSQVIEGLSGIKVLGIIFYNINRNKRRVRWLRKIGF